MFNAFIIKGVRKFEGLNALSINSDQGELLTFVQGFVVCGQVEMQFCKLDMLKLARADTPGVTDRK